MLLKWQHVTLDLTSEWATFDWRQHMGALNKGKTEKWECEEMVEAEITNNGLIRCVDTLTQRYPCH